MRVLRLGVTNWRNFRQAEAPLQQRVFIIGPNASGKSNLLDALLFLKQIATQGFRDAIGDRGSVSKIRNLHARRDPEISLRLEIGDDSANPEWVYELKFGQDNQRQPVVRSEVVEHNGLEVVKRPDQEDDRDSLRLSQTYLEQVNANKQFRPLVDFFSSIRYLHLVPQIIRDPRGTSYSYSEKSEAFGSDFLERIASTVPRTRNARLRRINEVLRVAVPQLADLHFTRDERDGTPHIEATFEHWRPGAGRQREAEFSDGTLRLIGLLWAVLDGSGPLVLEEPELSLNAAIVKQIPQLFRRALTRSRSGSRQILMTTHSFDLLQDPGIDPSEVLLLSPESQGTTVKVASDIPSIRDLVEGGVSIGEAALPYAEPKNAYQLPLIAFR